MVKASWFARPRAWSAYVFSVIIASPCAQAQPAPSLAQIAQNQDATASALFMMLANYSMVAGIGIAMLGLLQIAFAHKKQESMRPGAIMLIVGGVLASIIAVLHTGSATVFGTDVTSLHTLGKQHVQ